MEKLFNEPFIDGDGENDTNLWLKDNVRVVEKTKKMKVKHIPTYKEVEEIYNTLINELWNNEPLDRDDIRKIIKIN